MAQSRHVLRNNAIRCLRRTTMVRNYYVRRDVDTGVSSQSWGQDYKEKHKTRLKTNVKRTVLNNTKLRHF